MQDMKKVNCFIFIYLIPVNEREQNEGLSYGIPYQYITSFGSFFINKNRLLMGSCSKAVVEN